MNFPGYIKWQTHRKIKKIMTNFQIFKCISKYFLQKIVRIPTKWNIEINVCEDMCNMKMKYEIYV